jgi:type IV pilus assembly protein PilC
MAASALFVWEGTDKQGRRTKGEIASSNPAIAKAELRKQGINATRVRKKGAGLSFNSGKSINSADISLFTARWQP